MRWRFRADVSEKPQLKLPGHVKFSSVSTNPMGGTMKSFLLTTAAVLGISGAASATDLPVPVKAPIVAPVPLFSWTGCYIGGHVGYGKGQTNDRVTFDDVNVAAVPAEQAEYHFANIFNNKGGVYGLQGGCNYQAGLFVAGLEGDYSWSDLNDSYSFIDPVEDAPNVDAARFNSRIRNLASIRGRFGIAADRALVYATLGWGWADFRYSFVLNDSGLVNVASHSTSADGIVYGGGVNYALTDWLILRAEYLHYAVGKNINLVPVPEVGPAIGDRAGIQSIDVVRVGADWKFNWWGAPVGRY